MRWSVTGLLQGWDLNSRGHWNVNDTIVDSDGLRCAMLLQGASGKSEQKSSIWCGILKIDANFRAKMLLTLAFGSKIRSIGERFGIVRFL